MSCQADRQMWCLADPPSFKMLKWLFCVDVSHWAHYVQSVWWSAGSMGQARETRWRKWQRAVSTVTLSQTGLQRASSALCPITGWPREQRFLTQPVSGKQSTVKHTHPTLPHLTAEATFRPAVILLYAGFSTCSSDKEPAGLMRSLLIDVCNE